MSRVECAGHIVYFDCSVVLIERDDSYFIFFSISSPRQSRSFNVDGDSTFTPATHVLKGGSLASFALNPCSSGSSTGSSAGQRHGNLANASQPPTPDGGAFPVPHIVVQRPSHHHHARAQVPPPSSSSSSSSFSSGASTRLPLDASSFAASSGGSYRGHRGPFDSHGQGQWSRVHQQQQHDGGQSHVAKVGHA